MKRTKFILPLLCFVLVIVLFKYVVYIGYVSTESMAPTIPAGSKIFGLRVFGELDVGDIIIFNHEGAQMVKRIAACPGGTVTRNIARKEYIVPKDCYYVLGDNSANSYDSRYWKDPFIRKNNIIAVLIYP